MMKWIPGRKKPAPSPNDMLAAETLDAANAPDVPAVPLDTKSLPVIWMLGKTGAGKSSLIQLFTGSDAVEVGNGYAACTKASKEFCFPAQEPVLRFLDTRGLGEVGYDADEDLKIFKAKSRVVLLVVRLDDPVQTEILEAVEIIQKKTRKTKFIVVFTGLDLVTDDGARERVRRHFLSAFQRYGKQKHPPAYVEMSLKNVDRTQPQIGQGLEDLRSELWQVLPEVALLLAQEGSVMAERRAFRKERAAVLGFSLAAGASDGVPLPVVGLVVGTVCVPTIQGAMLARLAVNYGVEWDRARLIEFCSILGLTMGAKVSVSLGVRQLPKLIPGYGQTIGAATAATLSFASTFALGRAAGLYLFHLSAGPTPNVDELKKLYREAFALARRTT